MNGRSLLAPAAARPGPVAPVPARPVPGSPPDPPEGNPLVITSFAGVALTAAARHHAAPATNTAGWVLLAALAVIAVALIVRQVRL
jgi:hypothetical protein